MKYNAISMYDSGAQLEALTLCDKCGEEIYEGEIHGERDGEVLCLECANDKWYSLSTADKFDLLGYDVVGLRRNRFYDNLRD